MRKMNRAYARKRKLNQLAGDVIANPVLHAFANSDLRRQIDALKTDAGLHAMLGAKREAVILVTGQLLWIAYNLAHKNMPESPDTQILLVTSNALDDVMRDVLTIDDVRATLQSGLAAANRVLDQHTPEQIALTWVKFENHMQDLVARMQQAN